MWETLKKLMTRQSIRKIKKKRDLWGSLEFWSKKQLIVVSNSIKCKKIEEVTHFLKIIAEENRLKILCILNKEKEACVCSILKELNLSQNLTSHHLKVLKDFNLISS